MVPNNRVQLLIDGAEAFPAMLDAIARAKQSIAMASYIFAGDTTGVRFRDALIERVRAGIPVRLMIDGLGSFLTDEGFFAPFVEAGGSFIIYRRPSAWRPAWTLRRRDHRKMLVVDDEIGFIGGLNVGNNYAPLQWGGEGWHDMQAKVEGPAAREMTRIFNRTWRRLTGDNWDYRLAPATSRGEVSAQVLESRIAHRYVIQRAYVAAIERARETVRITNAYFVPTHSVQRALGKAAARGVRVQLLLAGATDVPPVLYAARALYQPLMERGIEVYEWHQQVLHAKSAVIDGCWCTIGSYNFNHRSLLHDLEATVACVDATLGRALDQQFEDDLMLSHSIDQATWHRREPHEKILEQIFYKLRVFL